MSTLTLSTECVEAALRRFLAGRFSHIHAGVEHDKAVVRVTKFISFRFTLWCDQPVVERRVRVHYSSSIAASIAMAFAKKQVLHELPFIEKMEGGECVIALDKIELAGARLEEWADVKKVELPAANGTFCAIQFTIKESATCPS